MYNPKGLLQKLKIYLGVLLLFILGIHVLISSNDIYKNYEYIGQRKDNNFTSVKLNLKLLNTSKLENQKTETHNNFYLWEKESLIKEGLWNFRNFSHEEIDKLSVLGRRLFLHENIGAPKNKSFIIYIYKFGQLLEERLINHFTKSDSDPFRMCSVNNCRISYSHKDFDEADAVIFFLHQLPGPPTELKRTNLAQRWVWMSDESNFNTFAVAKDKNLDHYNNFFNWSMTYRTDSDVPIPYGRTIPLLSKPFLNTSYIDVFSRKSKTVAVMGSVCTNRHGRWSYVIMLKTYIDIDIYGSCGSIRTCEGHIKKDCSLLSIYKFYLAFENSNCKDYITEKVWWNAIKKEAVPVVMGINKSNYERMLPPNSFIHVEDFDSPEQLATYLRFLSGNKEAYNKYHEWRSNFKVVNEHGYFQSNVFHYCRLCEALNYNSPQPKVYDSMQSFLNVTRDCNKKVLSNIHL